MPTQLQTEHGIVRVPTGTWHVDPAHSSVQFEVKHKVLESGRFLVGNEVKILVDVSAVKAT
jgi:polyisoprenoid-binding protein YceI